MTVVRLIVIIALLLVLQENTLRADDAQKTAEGMMDRARQLSDIRAENAPGFRLQLVFSYVGKDLETLQTYTEVWNSNSQWRREIVVGNFRRVEIGGTKRHWLLDNDSSFPEEAERVLAVADMFPPRSAKFKFESLASPDAATRCAVTEGTGEQHAKHAFCFDQDQGALVENISPQLVGRRMGDFACSFSAFRKFGACRFPREMKCLQEGHSKMEAKVVELISSQPNPAEFQPPAGAVEMGTCSLNLVPPKAISNPYFGLDLEMQHYLAPVEVWLVVDIKGHPQNLKIIKSAANKSDDSALLRLRNWRFKPATCNGEPMPMPITVKMNFGPR